MALYKTFCMSSLEKTRKRELETIFKDWPASRAVYRSTDGTCVANQIARLRDSRSLRYANEY